MFRQAILVAVLSFLFFLFFHGYTKLGVNYYYKKHHPGDCRAVKGVEYGSEDFQVTKDGLAFISSGVNFPSMPSKYQAFLKEHNVKGRVLLFDFNKPDLGAVTLKIRPTENFDLDTFQPHGVSLLEDDKKGEHLIYVVNHPKGGKDRIEKFRFIPSTKELEHLKFFSNYQLFTTNDLAVVEEDRFYISNYAYFDNHFLSMIELMVPLPIGGLMYFDGVENQVSCPVRMLAGPNGVTLSKDKKFIYVAFPLLGVVRVYTIQKEPRMVQEVDVHSCVDNLHLDVSGNALLVGSHPIPHKAFAHLDYPINQAPSSVLRLPLSDGLVVTEEITELFYDHGDLISASTVAHIRNNQMLIGSVMSKLVVCDLYGPVKSSATGKSKTKDGK